MRNAKLCVIAVGVVLSLGLIIVKNTYSYQYSEYEYVFTFIGPETLYVNVNTQYEEYGVKVTLGDIDVSDDVAIDYSELDMSNLGEYKVKYSIESDNGEVNYVYREVVVIDKIKPVITLNGDNVVYINVGESYVDAGYVVTDNYDKSLGDSVKVSGEVNTKKTGEYVLTYEVSDSSGNVGNVSRTVIVG